MGTLYTNCGVPSDFTTGREMGTADNIFRPFGAQTYTPYAAPTMHAPPHLDPATTGPGSVVASRPDRELTPKDRAELWRRKANRAAITRKAPLFKRIAGHVVSCLDTNGRLITNERGDFANGSIVPRAEHLRRLERHYRDHWEQRRERREAIKDSGRGAARCYLDALERLDLLASGLFPAPVSRDAMTMACYLYRKKRTMFGGEKIVRNKVKCVRIREFDRRLRKFIDLAYSGAAYAEANVDGYPLHSLSARQLFYAFCSAPSSFIQTD